MNVYKFIKDRNTYQIVVAECLGDAAKLSDIDYKKVSVLYKDIIVDKKIIWNLFYQHMKYGNKAIL